MTLQERKSLAEQLIGNPLYHAVFADLEKAATAADMQKHREGLVSAQMGGGNG